ncbi:MAG: hypothetical protein ACXWUG_23775 [Polyangiales bacterium]
MKRVLTLLLVLVAGCGGAAAEFDPAPLPPDLRADYRVFARRCSKCHGLERPLQSGIDDDEYWAIYVARMRRMPGSGINEENAVPILRFLRWYAGELRHKRARSL